MINANEHVEDYLNYYIKSPKPGFAVMLKGKWGSGKTWFIKDYCERNLSTKKEPNKQRYLYVSLYGISSYSEIEDSFFQQLHPVLSSKPMAIAGKILKGTLKTAIKVDFNNDGSDDGAIR